MKNIFSVIFLCLTLLITSCEVVEGIFQVGFWAGIIVVVLIIAIIFWLFRKIR